MTATTQVFRPSVGGGVQQAALSGEIVSSDSGIPASFVSSCDIGRRFVDSRPASDELSASSLMLQLRCEHRWKLQKLDGLVSPMLGRSGQIGSFGHRIMAAGYIRAFATRSVDAGLQAARVAAELLKGEDDSGARRRAIATGVANVGDSPDEAIDVAIVGALGSLEKYLPSDLKHYELLGVEAKVRHIIPGMRVAHNGVIDLLLVDRARKHIVVVDHKFSEQWAHAMTQRIGYDPQRRAYQWHMERVAPGHTVEFAYNVIRAKAPSDIATAKCCKNPRCDQCAGGGVRFSRSSMDTTLAKLEAFLRANPALAFTARAEELRADLKANDGFWSRVMMTPAPTLVDGWLDEVRDAIRNRRSKARSGRWAKNRSQCSTVYGTCPFVYIYEDTPEARAPFLRRWQPGAIPEPEDEPEDEFTAPF